MAEGIAERLRGKRVALLGIGGIGSHVAIALCRAGVGTLRLIDFDTVEESNLGRQIYTRKDIGISKGVALKAALQAVMPQIRVEHQELCLTKENIKEQLAGEEYLIEAFDRAETKALLTPELLHLPKLKLLVGCCGMAGWGDAHEIVCRRMRKNWYLCGDFKSDIDTEGKITAARVMVCAGLMAHQMLRVLIEGEDLKTEE